MRKVNGCAWCSTVYVGFLIEKIQVTPAYRLDLGGQELLDLLRRPADEPARVEGRGHVHVSEEGVGPQPIQQVVAGDTLPLGVADGPAVAADGLVSLLAVGAGGDG